jgi:prefoldin subunit 5
MATLNLVLDGKSFPVPKRSLFDLFEHRPELFQATTYAVQSSVSLGDFEMFVSSLKTQTKISVTKENTASLSLLAKEFFLHDLASECAASSTPADALSSLTDRVSKLELQVCSFSNPPRDIDDAIESQEEVLEHLRQEVERLSDSIDRKVTVALSRVDGLEMAFEILRGEVESLKASVGGEMGKLKSEAERTAKCVSGLEALRGEVEVLKVAVQILQQGSTRAGSPKPGGSSDGHKAQPGPKSVPPVQQQPTSTPSRPMPAKRSPSPPLTSGSTLEIPMKVQIGRHESMREVSKSLDGIISYLTKKHGENVHYRGIVTITSKSTNTWFPPSNVADLTSREPFESDRGQDGIGQWICWDFREMRIRPTHYTIQMYSNMKSWVVEGSLDGSRWTEIDRPTDNQDFKGNRRDTASFAVSNAVEFRFIRLTQTGEDHRGKNSGLAIDAIEFFGTLSA